MTEIAVDPNPCFAGWGATVADNCNYTGGHYCIKSGGHPSRRHRCICEATTTRRDALESPPAPLRQPEEPR